MLKKWDRAVWAFTTIEFQGEKGGSTEREGGGLLFKNGHGKHERRGGGPAQFGKKVGRGAAKSAESLPPE